MYLLPLYSFPFAKEPFLCNSKLNALLGFTKLKNRIILLLHDAYLLKSISLFLSCLGIYINYKNKSWIKNTINFTFFTKPNNYII
jgi:hypothetical protein